MLRVFIVVFCLYGAAYVHASDKNIISIVDDTVLCGPISCPLNVTHMCFHTSRLTTDANNASSITTCGTCLSVYGGTVKEDCNTESTTLTNYSNLMSISLMNSRVDEARFRNGITGLLMSEMAGARPSISPPVKPPMFTPNGPSISTPVNPPIFSPNGPSVQVTTPASAFYPQAPIIVVQPPAQQIYFSQPPKASDQGYSYDTSRPERSPGVMCNPPDSPDCLRQKFQPNGLPPQVDQMYNDIRLMHQTLNRMQSTVQDMAAGVPIGYLDDPNVPNKQHFPVYTPPRY